MRETGNISSVSTSGKSSFLFDATHFPHSFTLTFLTEEMN